jgi:hypothetical protein
MLGARYDLKGMDAPGRYAYHMPWYDQMDAVDRDAPRTACT